MKLLDLLTSAWAILPEQLLEIQAIYASHLRGDKIDIDAIEARLGRPLASEQQDYQIRQGGVAVLTLDGVMAPKANMFSRISGGISTQMAGMQIESAIADPRIKAMVLAIDSPGGSVFGTPELGATVRELAAIKPIVTVSEATLASAAYWVGSAANAVYISGPTVQVGSIGVVANHNYDPQAKGTTTEITAGKYKRIASATGPLSEEGKAYMQGQVDHLYSVFVDAVAANRGASTGDVLAQMADGRVFIGQQAIDRGLVDGYSTVDSMVEQLATNPDKFTTRRKAVFALGGLPPKPAIAPANSNFNPEPPKGSAMDRATLEQQHPALFAQLKTEFSASAQAAGAAAERQRIADVRGQSLSGHEALIEQLATDGKTTGAEAAVAVLAAERVRMNGAAAAHFADAPPAAKHAAAPVDTPEKPTARSVAESALALFNGIKGA
jgi:signal peptide peptidase SppA